MLVDSSGPLAGIFTDSDLARLFEHHRDNALDAPIHCVMTANPLQVPRGSLMSEAVALMAQRKISELPVVDDDGRPVGLIDVTNVVGLFPQKVEAAPAKTSRPEGWGIVGGGESDRGDSCPKIRPPTGIPRCARLTWGKVAARPHSSRRPNVNVLLQLEINPR